jgi:hypothetical protein
MGAKKFQINDRNRRRRRRKWVMTVLGLDSSATMHVRRSKSQTSWTVVIVVGDAGLVVSAVVSMAISNPRTK